MDKYLNINNNYEILRFRGNGNVYSYLNQCIHYDERISAKLFFDKYELKFKDLRFIKKQFLDGFIRYVHPNNNIYIFEVNVYNWYTIDEFDNNDNNNIILDYIKIGINIEDPELYNKISNMLLKKNKKKNKRNKRKKNIDIDNGNNNFIINKKLKI